MKYAKAKTKRVRISPRKARLSASLIRGLLAEEALFQLKCSKLKGSKLLNKTLKSAIANAKDRFNADEKKLKVFEVRVDEGPTMKRGKSKNRGGQVPIMKRTSHFTVVLAYE
jgi:large subunit ribosomal protein L22